MSGDTVTIQVDDLHQLLDDYLALEAVLDTDEQHDLGGRVEDGISALLPTVEAAEQLALAEVPSWLAARWQEALLCNHRSDVEWVKMMAMCEGAYAVGGGSMFQFLGDIAMQLRLMALESGATACEWEGIP